MIIFESLSEARHQSDSVTNMISKKSKTFVWASDTSCVSGGGGEFQGAATPGDKRERRGKVAEEELGKEEEVSRKSKR